MAGEPTPGTTGNAEDRKAAAALSSIETRGVSGADEEHAGAQAGGVDTEKLGAAMRELSVGDKGKGAAKGGDGTQAKRKVKVDAKDVDLVVEQLELSKVKATELLKAHDGDVVKALTAFVTASA